MTTPVWFFSSLAQSIAAIAGFIITVGTVIYQLDQNERRNRTESLRKKLREYNNKYEPAINSTMELLKQPYDDETPTELPEDSDLSPSRISCVVDKKEREYPVRDEIWMYCRNISVIMEKITNEDDSGELFLLSEDDIEELATSAERLSNLVYRGEYTLQNSIKKAKGKDDISVKECVFDEKNTEYICLNDWFDQHLETHRQSEYLNGTNLISISTLFNELRYDSRLIKTESKHTSLTKNIQLISLLRPILLLVLFGIITPLAMIIKLQTELNIPYITIIHVQLLLLLIVSGLISYIVYITWIEI